MDATQEIKSDTWSERHAGMCGTCEFSVYRRDFVHGNGVICTCRDSEHYQSRVTAEDGCNNHSVRKFRSRKPAIINQDFENAVREMIESGKKPMSTKKVPKEFPEECGSCEFHKFDFRDQRNYCRNPKSWFNGERKGNHEGCDCYESRKRRGTAWAAR